MKSALLLLALPLAVVPACLTSSTGPGSGGINDASTDDASDVTTTQPTLVCAPAVTASTADEVLAIIEGLVELMEDSTKPSSGLALRPSVDITVAAAIEIDAAAFVARRPACAGFDVDAGAGGFPRRCEETLFAAEKPFHTTQNTLGGYRNGDRYPSGVSCVTTKDRQDRGDGCARLRIEAGTTVRFQHVVERFHFGTDYYGHLVRVVRSCTKSCETSESRCISSTTCFVAGQDACILCDGEKLDVCACRVDSGGAAPDGTDCKYVSSDDTSQSGKCSLGSCR